MGKKRAYVVFHGKVPGVYDTWEETLPHVYGFSNAKFKGFATVEEAISAWDHHVLIKMEKKRAYVVFNGKVPGVYGTWEETQPHVNGFSNARFKGFATVEEANVAWDRHVSALSTPPPFSPPSSWINLARRVI